MLTAGQILKNKRESVGKSLDQAALDTKIQKRFLEYIEKDDYSPFESEIFLTGFLKIYSKYLDLDTEKILALYRRSSQKRKNSSQKKGNKRFSIKDIRLPSTRAIIISLIILFSLTILGYVVFQIYKFQSPPAVSISEPEDNISTEKNNITITGKTDKDAILKINDLPVEMDSEGKFTKEVRLNEGTNIITIKASKNNNNVLETLVTRKVTYTPSQEEEEPDNNTTTENKITLEVIGSPSWIKLDIDNRNVLSEVVQPSKKDYSVENTFYLITGRVTNTKLYFKDKIVNWKNSKTAGVAEMRCTIVDNAIKCE